MNEQQNSKKFKFKLFDLILYFICCHCVRKSDLKKRFDLYKKVADVVSALLDIKRILHQVEDYNNLKMLILNKEQYALMNFISKYNPHDQSSNLNDKFNNDKKFLVN